MIKGQTRSEPPGLSRWSPHHSCISNQNQVPVRLTAAGISSGDHTGEETPVPIPNTAVKLSGPMIVPTSAKVGIARFYFKNPADSKESCGVFLCPHLFSVAGVFLHRTAHQPKCHCC